MSKGDEAAAYVNDGEVVYDTCDDCVTIESQYAQLPEVEEEKQNGYSTVAQTQNEPESEKRKRISFSKACFSSITIVIVILAALLVAFFVSFMKVREEQENMSMQITKLTDRVAILSDYIGNVSSNTTNQGNSLVEEKFNAYIAELRRNRTSLLRWYLGKNNQLYQLFEDRVPYETAKTRCALEGGRLASKGFRKISKTIEDLTDKLIRPAGEISWIGLDSINNSSIWLFSSGMKLRNTNLLETPLSDSRGRCGAITTSPSIVTTRCDEAHYYLCEKSGNFE